MTTSKSYDKVIMSQPPPRKGLLTKSTKNKEPIYMTEYTSEDLASFLLEWYESSLSFKKFCEYECPLPRATFQRHVKNSGVAEMKSKGTSPKVVKVLVLEYLAGLALDKKRRTEKASQGNRYLTDCEEEWLYEFIRMLALMGHGVGRSEAQHIIDRIVNANRPDISTHECSANVLNRFLKKYPDLKNVAGASLCPQRACKATVETRDAMFTKLEASVKNLHAGGYVKWKTYSDIPKHCIYNMDEVGIDTTKHRGKVLGSILDSTRQYTITPEGDGKMNMHFTCCLTSRADGEFILFRFPWICVVGFVVGCRVC